MADDAAGKGTKKDESAVTPDAEKVASTAGAATEAAAAEDVADLDAESAAESKEPEDSADADDDDDDISLEPDDEEKSPKHMQGRHWALTAAAVVVIAIAAGTAVIGRLYEEQRTEERSSREALAAAQEFANVMINVDSTKLDESSSNTLDRSTGDFKKKYSESSTTLRQVMIENKAKATGVVVDSAVKSATADKVEVLLFIDQAVSNVAIPDARMDRSRVQITMEKVDGRWLASDVELT
ncbi:Mce-associated membrane protein [Mycobacteroides chelonae]|nr:Mce-associated membrane protein [Mycobacteroides chelonae]